VTPGIDVDFWSDRTAVLGRCIPQKRNSLLKIFSFFLTIFSLPLKQTVLCSWDHEVLLSVAKCLDLLHGISLTMAKFEAPLIAGKIYAPPLKQNPAYIHTGNRNSTAEIIHVGIINTIINFTL